MKNKIQISASMMCANLLDLNKDIEQLKNADIDYLHLDIMDGTFVNNITLGIDCCVAMANAGIPRDIHMLTFEPDRYVDRLHLKKNEIFQVHFEVKSNIPAIARRVHKTGARFGIAINPETDVVALKEYLPYIDVITIMMIKPGFAGQTMEDGMIDKVAFAHDWLQKHHYDHIKIEVDGNVSTTSLPQMYAGGARIFVAGTSSIFRKDSTITDGVFHLRNCI